MNDNLQNAVSDLIEKYVAILEENREPNEQYKYSAIDTFQQNWDLEAEDFSQMFLNSFKGRQNLLFHNSWGFIEKLAKEFPEETREMFRNLYDESIDVSRRITAFQAKSKELFPQLQEVIIKKIQEKQDERAISLYLAFRYPEKYILYKNDYYKNFCKKLGIKEKEVGQRFLHLQELADEIKQSGLLEDNRLVNICKLYSKHDWDDTYLIIQNILYVTFKEEFEKNKENFKIFYDGIKQYIKNNGLKFKLGEPIKQRKWFWVFDEEGYFNNKYIHYEFLLNENKISIDLHFESSKTKAQGFHDLCKPLPDFLEWKKWELEQVDSITHKNKVDLEDEDCVEKSIKALEELYKYTYPKLIEKVKLLKENISKKNPNEPMKNADKTPVIPLNQILFGAPGTGKTYHTKKMAVEIINGKKERDRKEINKEYEELIEAGQIVFTTFHQSLSYEDFIEGIKPETIDGNVTYEVKDGIFKSICKNAFSKEITSDNFEVVYQKLLDEIDNSVDNKLVLETLVHAKEFTIYKNSKNNIRFHSNTEKAYEAVIKKEVLEHYLKTGEALDWAPYTKSVANYIIEKYNYIQNEAIEPKKHVLIIDEINRGNVSAIFGELITLLEEDKRKGNPEHTEVKLPYSGDNFSVPNNVYIIGTMNTADRSVEALDTALRRRFSFVEMQPDPKILSDEKYKKVDLSKLLETINQRIEMLIDKDHQIGHSYFIGIQNIDDLKRTFKDKIIPLLEEYFYGDFGKIGLVLGGEFIKLAENQVAFPKNFEYEKNFLEDKKIYHITSSESWEEETFKSIYGEVGNAK